MWLLLPPPLQTRDLMGYPFFNLSISRSLLYFNCLQKSGTNWIGLHFHFLPISCGSRVYQIPMVWNENEEDDLWTDISICLGLHPPFVHGFPSYDWNTNTYSVHGMRTCHTFIWGEMSRSQIELF